MNTIQYRNSIDVYSMPVICFRITVGKLLELKNHSGLDCELKTLRVDEPLGNMAYDIS